MNEWLVVEVSDECGNILPGVILSNGQKSVPTKGDECDILINPKSRLQQVTCWGRCCVLLLKRVEEEEVQT